MKRFFKKASLLLVVLCLVVGSVLPSFAAVRVVDGVITYDEQRNLNTGDGRSVSTFAYMCFTGTYDLENLRAGNIAVYAECRGGYLDTHETELCIDLTAKDTINGEVTTYYDHYYYANSSEENVRYFQDNVNESYTTIYTSAKCYAWVDMIAYADAGDSWLTYYSCRWTPGQIGWTQIN